MPVMICGIAATMVVMIWGSAWMSDTSRSIPAWMICGMEFNTAVMIPSMICGMAAHNGGDDVRQSRHQRGQKLDARLDDLGDGVQQEGHNSVDDLRQSRDEHRQGVEDALGQPRDQLQSRVQDEGQIGDEGLADLHHHLHNGGNQLGQCGSDTGSQGRHHLHRGLEKLGRQLGQAGDQLENDGQGGCGQLGQRVHNAGDQGGDDIHPGFQQYRKAGEDGFSDDRHNGGELLHEYVHQTGDALGKGLGGAGGAVQHTLQPLAHEGHEGDHGSKNIRRHGLQRGHDGFRNGAQLCVGIGEKRLGALGFHHIPIEGFVAFRRFLVQAVEGIGDERGAFLLGTAAIQRDWKASSLTPAHVQLRAAAAGR